MCIIYLHRFWKRMKVHKIFMCFMMCKSSLKRYFQKIKYLVTPINKWSLQLLPHCTLVQIFIIGKVGEVALCLYDWESTWNRWLLRILKTLKYHQTKPKSGPSKSNRGVLWLKLSPIGLIKMRWVGRYYWSGSWTGQCLLSPDRVAWFAWTIWNWCNTSIPRLRL